jgi:hypothetical protein
MSIPTVIHSTSPDPIHPNLPNFGMIVSAQFSVSGFSKRWIHCNQLANYLARYASANEPDPERRSTLLSTFFNEVLEFFYRNQPGHGQIKLAFQKKGKRIALRAEVPVDERTRIFYRRIVEIVNRPDLDNWYREWLEQFPGEGELDSSAMGLLELAAVYDSVLSVEEPADGSYMRLSIQFPCESEEEME